MKQALAVATLCCLIWIILSVASPLSSQAADSAAGLGDAQRGEKLFAKRCGGCHSLDKDQEGPHLRGVYGRKAGSIAGFNYSDAVRASQVTWGDATLEKWLTDTESLVPDNDMEFHVPNPAERADIIRYLRVSSGK